MNNVNLKRFVNVDINPHVASKISTVRDTIALFTPEGTLGNVKEFENLAEVTYATTSQTYAYLKIYFDNGGIKAKVYEGIGYGDLTEAILKSLPNELICVSCVVPDANVETGYAALKALAISMNSDPDVYGINEKFIIARTNDYTYVSQTDTYTVDSTKVKNFAVKFSSTFGAEMTIAAYVSQTDINKTDSVYDYAFTEEKDVIAEEDATVIDDVTGDEESKYENISFDKLYAAITKDSNMNVDIYLSNAIRNCGGNCKDGYDLINSFIRIVLHQTLTDELMNLLTQKIKSVDGVSKIYAVLAQELEKYKNCGYLTTDKIWKDKPYIVNYNNENYTIINTGDALLNGYLIKILPMASLTDQDKENHSTPPIYVIIADQYGIRKITINGEII